MINLLFKTFLYVVLTKAKFTFTFAFVLGLLVSMAVVHVIYVSSVTVKAQSVSGTGGNQTMDSGSVLETNDTISTTIGNLIPYSNPNLGFSLEYPSNWQKEEILTFVSPQGGIDNRTPEIIRVTTEVLPTSDFGLDRYSEAALGQVESLQDFKLLNSSSTTLAGLPASMILYTFTEESQTPLQILQIWTVTDGMAYIITYNGTPEEFDSSLSALQSVVDSFRLAEEAPQNETNGTLSISPPTSFTEVCGDNIDNDFDGRADESCPAPPPHRNG